MCKKCKAYKIKVKEIAVSNIKTFHAVSYITII